MTWFKNRFTADATKLRFDCVMCGKGMWFPASKHGKYLTCGGECASARRESLLAARRRPCVTCGAVFLPRTSQIADGGGKYCSNACAAPTRAAGRTPEAAAKRGAARKAAFAVGAWAPLRGSANGQWKGGKAAYRERQSLKDPRIRAAKRRAYVQANQEKAREWRQKRRGLGRLPRGTISRIGASQRWRCAACATNVRVGYHVDHIMPLALGGEHAPGNLQLLCGPCNVRKWAKHPIDFMQEKGFLL